MVVLALWGFSVFLVFFHEFPCGIKEKVVHF